MTSLHSSSRLCGVASLLLLVVGIPLAPCQAATSGVYVTGPTKEVAGMIPDGQLVSRPGLVGNEPDGYVSAANLDKVLKENPTIPLLSAQKLLAWPRYSNGEEAFAPYYGKVMMAAKSVLGTGTVAGAVVDLSPFSGRARSRSTIAIVIDEGKAPAQRDLTSVQQFLDILRARTLEAKQAGGL